MQTMVFSKCKRKDSILSHGIPTLQLLSPFMPIYWQLGVFTLLKELATNIIYCHPSPHHQLSSVKNVLLLLVDTFLKLMSA